MSSPNFPGAILANNIQDSPDNAPNSLQDAATRLAQVKADRTYLTGPKKMQFSSALLCGDVKRALYPSTTFKFRISPQIEFKTLLKA